MQYLVIDIDSYYEHFAFHWKFCNQAALLELVV